MNPDTRPALTALVTGGSKGIGRAVSLMLARSGVNIALLLRQDRNSAERLVAEIRQTGRRARAYYGDITDRGQVGARVAAIAADFGAIDMLVNNAGAAAAGDLLSLDDAAWQQVVSVNLNGCFVVGTEVAKIMRAAGGGSIVNIAGASADRCYPGAGAFGPSKAAVVNLTRQMAVEWADYGIRVNGVSPGPIRAAADDWQRREPQLAAEVARLPLRRAGLPEEVAAAVGYLLSPDAAYTTGQMLVVDGGGLCTWYMTR
ncbi:SDR family NAD(P)-dependent oxidoreductase [Acerihabitans arboris]|uniref:SDR family oxidoreductase n=1 Tax=Acerihabitans arboris TaxID=2691583 RepID=A0A845SKQ6_9GAMM|nr:SDR family NAD(P)-dependent oxidoreductase [Acerihabitans arboris]NDL63962.1 SDR family oxidoreductase [Acerihabitans arboris]